MKKLILNFSVLVLLLVSGSMKTVIAQENAAIDLMYRIIGLWNIKSEDGVERYEKWTRTAESTIDGEGYEIKQGQYVRSELLQIYVDESGKTFYRATVDHNSAAVDFELTEYADSYFVFENPEHDFPKKIEYFTDVKDEMRVVISGGEKSVEFKFNKVK